jgi:RHS repeat-associated protein
MTFVFSGCVGLTKHSSQTPWGALGLGAINGNTPSLGAGGATGGFGTPGQGGGSTASGMGGEGTPVAGMFFFHNDQIGSTKVITNSAGEMVTGSNGAANIVYNPYGDIDVDHSHGPDILRNKFTGQQLDNESGLYYYNARYYDPALGRFISADPLLDAGGSPSGMDPYMYVSGNPVKFNDPTGHKQKSYGKKMIADFQSAVVNHVAQYGSNETKFGFMTYAKRIKDHKKMQEARDAAKTTAIKIAIVVAVVVVSYLCAGSCTYGAVAAAQAAVPVTGMQLAVSITSEIAASFVVDQAFTAAGYVIGGYTSNGSQSWDSKGAARGAEYGSNVGFVYSLFAPQLNGIEDPAQTLDPNKTFKGDGMWNKYAKFGREFPMEKVGQKVLIEGNLVEITGDIIVKTVGVGIPKEAIYVPLGDQISNPVKNSYIKQDKIWYDKYMQYDYYADLYVQ